MTTELEWLPKGDWRGYEAYILGSLAAQFPGVWLEPDARLPGKKSGTMRQIDILAHARESVAFECKYFSRKVDVKCVETVLGMLNDVGLQRGVIVTAVGFSAAAKRRAANDDCDLQLELIEPNRLSKYQQRGAPLIFRAPIGISFGLVDGWTCDTELTNAPGGAVMMMYPLGHGLQSAMHGAPVIYANFLIKERGDETLAELAAPHQADIANDHPNYQFDIEHRMFADRSGTERPCLLRIARGSPQISGIEYALYVDYGVMAVVLVLCAPLGAADLSKVLLDVYRDSFPLDVTAGREEA
ncbi:restriction endonuclease [Sphingopyxis fribergensis]|jgi:hypothetical protein